jgi:uncharacterized protein
MNKKVLHIRQFAFTIYSFCYFLYLALSMTIKGFILLTLRGSSEEHKMRYHQILQKKSKYVINHIPGTSFSYMNKSKDCIDKPSIIICNHQSHLDIMALLMLSPKIAILTKKWVWNNPFYGIVIRYADFFPITETNELIERISSMIEKGFSVVIFPEGTRSRDCRIQRFHRGAFYIAEKLQLDILPIYIDGFGQVLPKESWHLHPGKLHLEIMTRIKREEVPSGCDYREMTKKMYHLYKEKRHEELRYHR